MPCEVDVPWEVECVALSVFDTPELTDFPNESEIDFVSDAPELTDVDLVCPDESVMLELVPMELVFDVDNPSDIVLEDPFALEVPVPVLLVVPVELAVVVPSDRP